MNVAKPGGRFNFWRIPDLRLEVVLKKETGGAKRISPTH